MAIAVDWIDGVDQSGMKAKEREGIMARCVRSMVVCLAVLLAAEFAYSGPPPLASGVFTVSIAPVFPDGKYIAFQYGCSSYFDPDNLPFLHVYPINGGRVKYVLTGKGGVVVGYSRDGKYLLTESANSVVRIRDTQTGKLLGELSFANMAVPAKGFTPDGKYLAVWKRPDRILPKIEMVPVPAGTLESVQPIVPMKEGIDDWKKGSLQLFDLRSGKRLRSFEMALDFIPRRISFSSDGRRALFHCGLDAILPGQLIVMDVEKGEQILSIDGQETHTNFNGCLDADGKHVVIEELRKHPKKKAEAISRLALWDVAQKKRLRRFEEREAPARALTLMASPDGKFVLTLDSDRKARLWDIAKGKLLWSITFPDKFKVSDPPPLRPWLSEREVSIPTFLADGKRVAFVFTCQTYRDFGNAAPSRDFMAETFEARTYDLATGKLVSEVTCERPWNPYDRGMGLGWKEKMEVLESPREPQPRKRKP